jgi:membrane protein implicated in regulation of membrane protease activity
MFGRMMGRHLVLGGAVFLSFWGAVGTFVWFLLGGPGWLPLMLLAFAVLFFLAAVLNFLTFAKKADEEVGGTGLFSRRK